jgi:glutamate--cysteine ligase
MRQAQQPFTRIAKQLSAQHAKALSADKLDEATRQRFTAMAAESLTKQQQLESKPQMPFDDFLQQYFAQK